MLAQVVIKCKKEKGITKKGGHDDKCQIDFQGSSVSIVAKAL